MQDFLFYFQLGLEHILSWDALDHQLFLMALVVVYRFQDLKKIMILVTAFTLGHSITLVLSVLDVFRIPANWVEFLIPITILITVLDNIFFFDQKEKLMKTNYLFGLFFGLIHGMGFANTARIMIAQEQSIVIPLLGFNVGLEIGQLVFVGAFLLLGAVFTNYLKIKKKRWIVFISCGILIITMKMIFDRVQLLL